MILLNRREGFVCEWCDNAIACGELVVNLDWRGFYDFVEPRQFHASVCTACLWVRHREATYLPFKSFTPRRFDIYLDDARKALNARLAREQEKQLRLPGI